MCQTGTNNYKCQIYETYNAWDFEVEIFLPEKKVRNPGLSELKNSFTTKISSIQNIQHSKFYDMHLT